MAERGTARYKYISSTSNTVVRTGPGTLYSISGTFPSGAAVRIDDAHTFGQGVLDINAKSSNSVGLFSASTVFVRGIGIDVGIAVAVSSNAAVTIEYE